MAKYLDPKADVTFKKVFGEHKNLDSATAERDAAVEKLRQDKLQTARNLKALNLTIEQIAAATGLAADEIEKL